MSDNVIHVDFARRGQAQPSPEQEKRARRFLPAAPPPTQEPKGTRDPLGDVYTLRDAAKVFGLSESRLRHWERSNFIVRSVHQGRLRFYSFEDLISIRAAKELLDEGVPLQSVRRSVEVFAARFRSGRGR